MPTKKPVNPVSSVKRTVAKKVAADKRISVKEAVASLPEGPRLSLPKARPHQKGKRPNNMVPFAKGDDPRRYKQVPQLARISDMKRRVLASSGMTPLDFLTAVYRDELYDDYVAEQFVEGVADPKLLAFARVWKPSDKARRVRLTTEQRITAANMAAPFFHSKRPVQLNVGNPGDEVPQLTKEQMRNMTPEELRAIIAAGEALGALPRGSLAINKTALGGFVTVIDDDGTIREVAA